MTGYSLKAVFFRTAMRRVLAVLQVIYLPNR